MRQAAQCAASCPQRRGGEGVGVRVREGSFPHHLHPLPPPLLHTHLLELLIQLLEQLERERPQDQLGRDAVGQQLVQLAADLQCIT